MPHIRIRNVYVCIDADFTVFASPATRQSRVTNAANVSLEKGLVWPPGKRETRIVAFANCVPANGGATGRAVLAKHESREGNTQHGKQNENPSPDKMEVKFAIPAWHSKRCRAMLAAPTNESNLYVNGPNANSATGCWPTLKH